MITFMNMIQRALICSVSMMILCGAVMGQVECSGWGELRGIRIDGQLIPVVTSLTIAGPGWRQTALTAHWKTRNPTYERQGENIVTTGQLGFGFRTGGAGVSFRQTISNAGPGAASMKVEIKADANINLDGVYMYVSVPAAAFHGGNGELVGAVPPANEKVNFATSRPVDDRHYVGATASGARFVGQNTLELMLKDPAKIVIEDDRGTPSNQLCLIFPIHVGSMKRGQSADSSFTLKVTGDIDHAPAHVQVDPSQPGEVFAGIGGNFCWQLDAPIVNYHLNNLRVALARVAFPMPVWQPQQHVDPTTQPTDQLPDELQTDLRMATELHRRKIPMIMSVWSIPDWALAPRTGPRGQGPQTRGKVDPKKWDALATSIGAYLLRFKQVVGTEPDFFSFNEANQGNNVLMSPTEHREAIKFLGKRFETLGLRTKLLLGDANEPSAVNYVKVALADPQAMQYVGAVSYHSWNGGTDKQLIGWHEHALEAHLPLFVAEAGFDPDGYRYRPIFNEPWYALEEIKLNLLCITLSQPRSILHWQFTPDYGLISGGSSPQDPIRTSQRWWQYKQLSDLTPPNAAILPITSDRPEIIVSALASTGQGVSVIHIANTGPTRPATITGLPSEIKEMSCYVTDQTRSMQSIKSVAVSNGTAEVSVPALSFLTLVRP
jgi:O-glycosyl hydrolase